MDKMGIAPVLRTMVVVVGAGIAGIWTALKLNGAGIDSIVIDYGETDRGGILGSSARSVGAVNLAPLERPQFRQFMDELGLGQVHPATVSLLETYLREELDELQTYGSFKRIKLGVAVAGGSAGPLLANLRAQYLARGGRILNAWVTRIVADEAVCRGVQYQQGDSVGKVLAPVLVLASGGYAGLFEGSVKTNNHGTLLGRFLQSGGLATNLEFVFKHGYGKPDLGDLTPTEELPGAEVYDDAREHVDWLERELYEGRGTANHLEAFKHWRNNRDKSFYIDLKYRSVYALVQALNTALAAADEVAETRITAAARDLLEMCPVAQRGALEVMVRGWIDARQRVDFDRFGLIKPFFYEVATGEVFRVRQIAYFSMGGMAHNNCATNLATVCVNGEAMHDFGAHRVGGLPWGLYLSTGRFISDRVAELLRTQSSHRDESDFELVLAKSHFDADLLRQIRADLYNYQERDLKIGEATRFIHQMRNMRRALRREGRVLDDAVSWTVVAESVIQASLRRTESRGCFYRSDHPVAMERMRAWFSCTSYENEADVVTSRMIRMAALPEVLSRHIDEAEYRAAVS
jgi:succinate dehydrogenase/fumarate reductase flavoprotein subunit